jgi:hypothetical protein
MNEVLCRQVTTSGGDINAIMAFLLCAIACGVALAAVSPQVAHWVALRIAAHAEAVKAGREASMRARQEFLAANAPEKGETNVA